LLLGLINHARMKAISGKEFARVLERHGWRLLRIKGSHHIYGKGGSDVRISVPIHGNQNLKTGMARHFLKMASLTENDL
jgi:predicted RNA binding protein YcfA (HicA-like mRNA interferase family)